MNRGDAPSRVLSEGWQTIETAPECVLVRLLLENGVECIAEYWPPAPVEIDPEQDSGGWAIECAAALFAGKMDDLNAPIVGWKPTDQPPDDGDELPFGLDDEQIPTTQLGAKGHP